MWPPPSCSKGHKLEIEQLGHLHAEPAVERHVPIDAAAFVIHDEEIAQWMVDEPVSDVGRYRVGIGVVLEEALKKHLRRECRVELGAHEIGLEPVPIDADDIPIPAEAGLKVDALAKRDVGAVLLARPREESSRPET